MEERGILTKEQNLIVKKLDDILSFLKKEKEGNILNKLGSNNNNGNLDIDVELYELSSLLRDISKEIKETKDKSEINIGGIILSLKEIEKSLKKKNDTLELDKLVKEIKSQFDDLIKKLNEIAKKTARVPAIPPLSTVSVRDIAGNLVNPATKESVENLTNEVKNSIDPLSLYKISDIDDASNPKYYGFLKADGGWYILKEDTTNKTYRYAKGDSDYSTAWTNRASQTYNYFDVVF